LQRCGGKGALVVTEEGRFEQVGGDGPGVDRDERIVAARRVVMQCLGDELLAGATFALDQYGAARGRDMGDENRISRSIGSDLPTMLARSYSAALRCA